MRCGVPGTYAQPAPVCRFNPGGSPQAGNPVGLGSRQDTYEFTFVPTNDTTWVFGDGFIYVACDTSARFVKQPKEGYNRASYNQPGYIYSTHPQGDEFTIDGGNVDTPLRCTDNGQAPYMSWFRPDSSYAYEFGASGDLKPCHN
jgi:hypothetical protein